MKENLYKKPHQKCKTAVKTFKKYQNVPTGTYKKRKILFHRFLGEYTLFLTLPSTPHFLKGGVEIPKNWVGGADNFLKTLGEGREKYKICMNVGFFHFNLLTISCHGN